ncbi:MAG: GNAT family N-acetyltransferase [Arachnia sp.]
MDAVGVQFRRAGARDAPELVRLRHAMFRSMAATGSASRPNDVDDESWYPAAICAIRTQMQRGTLAAFVVNDPAALRIHEQAQNVTPLIACAVAALVDHLPGPGLPRGLSGWISSVFVEVPHRGQGLARDLTMASLRWLEDEGAEIVDLAATPQAEGLYRSLGFTEPRSVPLRRVVHP